MCRTEKEIEIYYNIMNFLDNKALNNELLTDVEIYQLNINIARFGLAETATEFIRDLADANDCGDCATWNEVVVALRKLFENGERIRVRA